MNTQKCLTTCKQECPHGGDIANDCAECIYAGDYHYDPESGECVSRPE